MTALSFERMLKASRLAMRAPARDAFIADRTMRLTRADRDRLEGKVGKSAGASGGGGRALGLANKLDKRLRMNSPKAGRGRGKIAPAAIADFDMRQRAIVKIHYFSHGGGGGAALKAHGKYIARDAGRDGLETELAVSDKEERRSQARANADYLERGDRGLFYDAKSQGIDGAARLEAWAKSDLRHFRVILSAEEGGRLRDLEAYTREVMARSGAALGTQLSWLAVNHYDTDNPHTHIVVRGRRENGQDLVMPRDFIKHGMRSIARDVASEWLGKRTPEQEREALHREARRHGPTRLDRIIDAQAKDGVVRARDLTAPNRDPDVTQALKARVQELSRMGLAQTGRDGLLHMAPDWRDRLKSMELHLDIRKEVMRARMEQNLLQQQAATRDLSKGLMGR